MMTPEQFKAAEDQMSAKVRDLADAVRGSGDPDRPDGDPDKVEAYKAAQQELADFRQSYRAQAEVRGERTPGTTLEIEHNTGGDDAPQTQEG
ncbi:MAG: hypothetical protein AB7R77_12700 [Ilumatobacteraceae bacterium]